MGSCRLKYVCHTFYQDELYQQEKRWEASTDISMGASFLF